jgi:hypothetical protein
MWGGRLTFPTPTNLTFEIDVRDRAHPAFGATSTGRGAISRPSAVT